MKSNDFFANSLQLTHPNHALNGFHVVEMHILEFLINQVVR